MKALILALILAAGSSAAAQEQPILEPWVYVEAPVSRVRAMTAASAKSAPRKEYHVNRVIDGDTIVILSPDTTKKGEVKYEHIRLIGIDAPEWAHFGNDAECFASESTKALASAVLGRTVRLIRHGKDKYGRTLAYVYRTPKAGEIIASSDRSHSPERLKTVSINRWMLEQGYAMVHPRYPHAYTKTYKAVQLKTKAAKIGMWSHLCGPQTLLASAFHRYDRETD